MKYKNFYEFSLYEYSISMSEMNNFLNRFGLLFINVKIMYCKV